MNVPRETDFIRRSVRSALAAVGALALTGALATGAAAQQTGMVAGQITDAATMQPIAGVQVVAVGTGQSTLTGADGNFRLVNVPAGTREIRVTHLGYRTATQTVDVPAAGVAQVNFALDVAAIGLDAIVVTMVGEQRAREISNAMGTISVDQAVQTAPVTSIMDVMQGRTPGVTILESSGTVGTGAAIKIRGNSSISLGNVPVIYVDGIRLDNRNNIAGGVGGQNFSRINDLNPADIERIEILKGPAAATLYGTEAAAGVIQITTKRGIAGAPRFQVRQELGVNTRSEFRFTESVWHPQSLFGPAAADTLYSMNLLEEESPFRSGNVVKTSGSVRGGIEGFTYYLSGERQTEQGVFANNFSDRNFGQGNFNFAPTDNFDVAVSVGYTSSESALPDNDNNGFGYIGVGMLGFPWDRHIEVPDFDTEELITTCPLEREFARLNGVSIAQLRGLGFPMSEWCPSTAERSGFFANRNFDDVATLRSIQEVERFRGSTTLTWRPVGFLNNRLTFGYDQHGTNNHSLIPVHPERPFGSDSEGFRFIQNYSTRNLSLDYVGTLNFELNPDWRSNTAFGTQYFHEIQHGNSATGRVFPAGTPTVGAAADTEGSEFYFENKTLGLFAQQQFGFRDRLFLTAGLRADDNSAFGADYALVFYPKVGASWVVSDEAWFPELAVSDMLKLRATWGRSGKQPGLFDALQRFSPVPVAFQGGEVAGAIPLNIGNPDLAPEVGSEWELGFDLGLLEGRANLEFTYYDQITNDAIVSRQLAPSLGYPQAVFDNVGEMTNRGIELGLNLSPVQQRAVNWDVGFNFATNRNEITQLAEPIIYGLGGDTHRHTEGRPFASYFHPEVVLSEAASAADCAGIYSAGRCAYWAQADTSFLADGVTIDNIEGVHTFLGHPTPEWEGSFNTTLRLFGNFTVSGLLDFKGGHQLLNSTEEFRCGFLGGGRVGSVCPETFETTPMTDPATGETVAAPTDEALIKQFAARELSVAPWIEDANFTRLRSVSVRYDVPQQFAQRLGVGGLSVAFMGRNLATWTSYRGLDPEINFAGQADQSRAEFLTMPLNRQFVTSITVNF